MIDNEQRIPRQHAFQWRFRYLLIFLLLLAGLKPLAEIFDGLEAVLSLVLTAILISAINAVSQKKVIAIIGIILAAPVLITTWSGYFFEQEWFRVTADLSGILFFTFLAYTIFTFVISQDTITKDLIAGTAVVYLLMALAWMFAYRTLETVHPGSLYISDSHIIGHEFPFLYFSFVTITTLGYGDIYPVTTVTRTLASLEALIGQIYLVFTVARLVGMYSSEKE